MQMTLKQPIGMPALLILCFGQLISLLGSGMTQFALTLWVWQTTHSATTFAIMSFLTFGIDILITPFAGALIDRWNRKSIMMMTDMLACLSSIIVLLLHATNHLQIWHLFVVGTLAGALQPFQAPTYAAVISTLLRKEHYARASGILFFTYSTAEFVAPLLGGVLFAMAHIDGIMLIDILTFGLALSTITWVHIPQPSISEEGSATRGNFWKESIYGFRYLLRRRSLLGLQIIFLVNNIGFSCATALLSPMILSRTGDGTQTLAAVLSAGGVGGVAGSIVISFWGGPKRKIDGVLVGWALASTFGLVALGTGRSLPVWIAAAFLGALFHPILNGCNQAIWLAKVVPDIQGRVFAARRLIARFSLATLVVIGPLADQIFEPLMRSNGEISQLFGHIVGAGPGAGMALIFVLAGVLSILVSCGGYLVPFIRNLETMLPDHELAA